MIRLLGLALLFWEPLNFAATALQVLPSIQFRGAVAAAELFARAVIAVVAVGAGLSLLNGGADARRLATAAIVLTTARAVQSLYWSALPNSTVPGDEPFYAGIAVVTAAVALWVLHRKSGRDASAA